MSRLPRLYAIAETLRARAPRLVTVSDLAAEHGVSQRTVQRDLQSLMAAGIPVRWQEGRGGGWTVDPQMTLPPLNLTADEAAALLLAVRAASGRAPLARAADSALAKISTVLGASASSGARRWDQRLVVSRRSPQRIDTAVLEQALERHRLVSLDYADADGTRTRRDVEPAGLITGDGNWYLVGWCRLRQGYRGFRFDRIVAAELTDEVVPEHDLGSALRQDGNTGPGPRGKAPQADPREADWNHPAARTWSRRS